MFLILDKESVDSFTLTISIALFLFAFTCLPPIWCPYLYLSRHVRLFLQPVVGVSAWFTMFHSDFSHSLN